jgi:hypothetical protein
MSAAMSGMVIHPDLSLPIEPATSMPSWSVRQTARSLRGTEPDLVDAFGV